jgi:uncharacterized protein YkwD
MTVQEDRQQLFLELINRARLDPTGEAARYNLADLNAGLTAGTINTAAKQVLASNTMLTSAAASHNQYLADNDLFTHNGQVLTDPFQTRLKAADRVALTGYGQKILLANGTYGYTFGSGENLALRSSSGPFDANAEVLLEHRDLFLSAGHRSNMLNASYEEIGISAILDPSYQGYQALLTTHNYGYKLSSPVIVTGVVYTDADNNDFYSIGESVAGRTVQLLSGATVLGSTATANAGGYQIQTATAGAVEIVYSGAGLNGEQAASFTIGTNNVKADLVDGNTIETNVSATLTRAGANLTLLSIDNVNGTGNSLANIIKGNRSDNILNGEGGNDTLIGNNGNDTLNGGAGNDAIDGGDGTDFVVFSGNMADYAVVLNAGIYTIYSPDGSIDTVTLVENFTFADGTRTAAQLNLAAGAPTRSASIVAVAAQLAEGNSGTTIFTFIVQLNGSTFTQQTLNYSVAGSGANPANAADFSSAATGLINFPAGSSQAMITVQVVGDSTLENNETFTVTLSTPSAGLTLNTTQVVATITNDDAPAFNTINGTAAGDVLVGSNATDQINGFGGADTIDGGAGADYIYGGLGNDTIVFDNLDQWTSGGVKGGADNDTLRIINQAAPTYINLLAAEFEMAHVETAGGAPSGFASRVEDYNAAWQLTNRTTVNLDGSHDTAEYDRANAQVWSSVEKTYDTLNRVTFEHTTYDAGHNIYVNLDAANAGTWTTNEVEYNAAGQLARQQRNDDNSHIEYFSYDTANATNLNVIQAEYNAQGLWVRQQYTHDDTAIDVFNNDRDNAGAWNVIEVNYDLQNRSVRQQYDNDDGSRYIYNYDKANTGTWDTIFLTYDTLSRLTFQQYDNDDGSIYNYIYDPTDAEAWQSQFLSRTSTGQTEFRQSFWDDNAGSQTVSYDINNIQTWNTWTRNFDNNGNLLGEVYA